MTFAVEGWYTVGRRTEFSVWMPGYEIEQGVRLAVAGDAHDTEVPGFSGPSGEVEFCVRLDESEVSVAAWDDESGGLLEPVPAESVVPESPLITPDKVFGVHDGPCRSGILVPPLDRTDAPRDGPSCFVREFEAGRPVAWDHIAYSAEAAPAPSRFAYDGQTVTITRDLSFDGLGSGGVEEYRCAAVVLTMERGLEGVDCTVGQGSGFVPESILVDPVAP